MDDVIVLLALVAQVAVDHLSDGRCPIYNLLAFIHQFPILSSGVLSVRTREPHMSHFNAIFLQRFREHLALC
jgi:hypothetical protein